VKSISALSEEKTLFTPHPNLSDAVNRNIIGSEIEGGVFLDRLQPHSVLQIQTQHRCYTAVMLGGSQALISGHPEYCPQLTLVAIVGSTWGGSMLKPRFVGRGMHLKFCHPEYSHPGNPGVCRACAHLGSGRAAKRTNRAPLSLSALGGIADISIVAAMSACDPKRTW
jgi:ligand-binding sensor protein